jgi:hypothetical protein
VVVVIPRDGVIPQQETATNDTVHHMNDGNLIRSKDFRPSQSRNASSRCPTTSSDIVRLRVISVCCFFK